ncbi:MAG: bL28 family ribosomal protein [Candidatus Paceibacterota bacterium]
MYPYGTMREHMAKECAITKKTSQVGGKYANRTRATVFTPTGSHRKYANLQKKRVYVPEIDKTLVITVSTKGMRTIAKNGAYNALRTAGVLK